LHLLLQAAELVEDAGHVASRGQVQQVEHPSRGLLASAPNRRLGASGEADGDRKSLTVDQPCQARADGTVDCVERLPPERSLL
jgi:hypothetical protein